MTAIDSSFALDAHSLDGLRLKAKEDPQAALKAAAQQFEAVFLQTLLKSMRDATPQDGPMDSEQTRSLTEMLDQQLAQTLASRGIGLSEAMLKQLSPPASAGPAAGAQAPAPAPNAAGSDFVTRMKSYAEDASRASGVPAKFLIAQAALETGWGRHEIRAADGTPSFNVFGIKAGAHWKGATVDAMTTEFVNGVPRRVSQRFRAYASYADAFQDYTRLIRNSTRYASVALNDGASFAASLQRAGYATDPGYADKLTRVLNSVSA